MMTMNDGLERLSIFCIQKIPKKSKIPKKIKNSKKFLKFLKFQKIDSKDGENFKVIISNANIHTLENGSLTIREVKKEDGGHYMVQAINGVGPGISRVVHLTVNGNVSLRSSSLLLVSIFMAWSVYGGKKGEKKEKKQK